MSENSQRVEYGEDNITVHLREPITYKPGKMDEERTDHQLTLPKKVKGKHLKAMDKDPGEMGKSLALIASLAGIPKQAAEELDGRDVADIIDAMSPFLPSVPGTGL